MKLKVKLKHFTEFHSSVSRTLSSSSFTAFELQQQQLQLQEQQQQQLQQNEEQLQQFGSVPLFGRAFTKNIQG